MDFSDVAAAMPTLVPMVGTLDLQFLELAPHRAVLRLPDKPAYQNHIGGPHAGAMFTLAESATGALVLGNFGNLLAQATPLAMEATIRYRKVAKGDLLAEAVMERDPEVIRAELAEGERPEFRIGVTLRTLDGTITGLADFLWTLRPNQPAEPPTSA